MNESLKMGRKAFTIAVAVATILWTLGSAALIAPSNASAATAGNIIKGTTLSTVYYYAGDGQRYAFPNEKTYFTWYTDFSGVVTMTDSELAAIPLGGNIVYRPGSHWIKIQSDPKTYAVTPQGQIRWIESETVAVGLAGSDWNTFIDDVPDVFFVDYTVGTSLMSAASAYNGALVAGTTHLVWDGKVYNVTDAGMTANRFQSRFVLDGTGIVLTGMTSGGDLSAANSAMTDTAQLGGTVTGGLSVSLASDTPASATIPGGAASVPFTTVKFTATSGSATIDQLVFTLGGIGAVGNLEDAYLYEDGSRLTKGRSINATTREVTFSALDLDLANGESVYLTVKADASIDANGGDTALFKLASASAVSGTATVSGTFPVSGNSMSFSDTNAGDLNVSDTGSISDPVIGEQDAIIGKIRLEADGEDASVEAITLNVDSAGDHSDYALWNSDDKLATCTASSDLVTCELTKAFDIADGDSETFELSADVGGENNDDITVSVEERADVVAIGGDYGFYLNVDLTEWHDQVSTVQGGDLTFAFNGPNSGDIQLDGSDQVVFKFAITSQNWSSIEELWFNLAADGDGLIDGASGDPNYEDITIRTASGSTWMGPVALDDGGDDGDQDLQFDDAQVLDAGETIDLMLTVDVANVAGLEDDVVVATLYMDTVDAEDTNGDAVENIVPGADMEGNDFTVVSSALDVTVSSPPNSGTYVKGTSNVDSVGFSFTAGNASDVTVTDFLVTSDTDSADDIIDHVNSCSLYDKTSGSLIDGPKAPDADDATFDFDNFNWTIAAGETEKVLVRCNYANVDTTDGADEYIYFIDNIDMHDVSSDIVAEDEDGNEVDAIINNSNDGGTVVIEIVDAGELFLDVDGSTPTSTILLGNSTDVTVGVFEFDSTEEGFTVTDLTIVDDDDCTVASAVTLSYKNEAGTTKEKTGYFAGCTVTFSGLDFWVASDATPNLTVMIDTNDVSATGTESGDWIWVGLEADTLTFKAVGASSGETITDLGTTAWANEMIVRKTKPTVSLASGSPSGSGVPGLSEVLRFNVSADSRGDVDLYGMYLKLNSSANGGDLWNMCNYGGDRLDDGTLWEVYNSDDASTKIDTDWIFYDEGGHDCGDGDAEELQWAWFDFDPTEEIASGDTNTYVVRVDTSEASSADDDSIRLDIPSEDDTPGGYAIWWGDGEDGDIDGEFIKNLPVTGGTIVY